MVTLRKFPESVSAGLVELTAAVAWHRMKDMVHEYSTSSVYCQWNSVVDELSGLLCSSCDLISTSLCCAGEIIETVKQLQSLEFLEKVYTAHHEYIVMDSLCLHHSQLEGEKRKNAIKLNLNQRRNAIMELFKYLKKQGIF